MAEDKLTAGQLETTPKALMEALGDGFKTKVKQVKLEAGGKESNHHLSLTSQGTLQNTCCSTSYLKGNSL